MRGLSRLICLPLLLTGCSGIARLAGEAGEDSSETSTAETGTSAGSSSDTSDEGETAAFAPSSDWTGLSECDPWLQDCPEGDKCVPYASSGGVWDANKCVPILGEQTTGEPCTYAGPAEATDDCDATGVCWNAQDVDGELLGTCAPFCTGTADDPICPAGSSCPIAGDATITICQPNCDPIAQDCREGTACFWVHVDFLCVYAARDIPPGQPCGFINDCAGGSTCSVAEVVPDCAGSACCTPFCELGLGDGPCEAVPGSVCTPFFIAGEAPPEYAHIGVCLLPDA